MPQDSVEIYSAVKDAFTYELIPDVKVEVLDENGEVTQTRYTSKRTWNVGRKPKNLYELFAPKKKAETQLRLRLSKIGYAEDTVIIKYRTGRRETSITVQDIFLKKKFEYALDEVVIEATRVKMVIKNDTIEYDARAFQLSEGSMLDALVRQLPGVELDDNGRITVNGRFVSSLLVNGEEFFKGDSKIALENLPSYMVDKVKVYEKESGYAYLMGGKREKAKKNNDPLVMDVRLKRDYSVGWIANAEGGYGSKDRYLGRIFGLRFTDNSRLALFANLNNVNDTREPGSSGSWVSTYSATGQTDSKSGGLDWFVKDREGKWKAQSNVKARHLDIAQRTESSNVRFFENGDVYNRSRVLGDANQTTVSANSDIEFPLEKIFLKLSPKGEYHRYHRTTTSLSADFTASPSESYRGASLDSIFYRPGSSALENYLTNRLEDSGLGCGYSWKGGLETQMQYKIPHTPDLLSVIAKGNYEKSNDKRFSHYDLRYVADGNTDFRNQYDWQPSENYDWEIQTSYRISGETKAGYMYSLYPVYAYSRSYSSGDRSLYRLDQIPGWDNSDVLSLGTLPSNTDEMQQVMDSQNSYNSTLTTDIHCFRMNFVMCPRPYINWGINWSVDYNKDHLLYKRASIDEDKTRHSWLFEGGAFFDDGNGFQLDYNYKQAQPLMTDMLDVTDDSNPLYVWKGAKSLKNTDSHAVKIAKTWRNSKKGNYVSISANYKLWVNSVGQSVVYDRKTGVTTTTPQNINGNWYGDMLLTYNGYLDKKKQWSFYTQTSGTYRHSVDFVSVVAESNESPRSSVDNYGVSETMKTSYKLGKHSIGANAIVEWNYVTSPREDFSTIRSFDINYGIIGTFTLPYDITLSTDLTMYSRRGYEDSSMNTNDLVWNARLSKSFLKGNLSFMLDGFDILGQLSNVRHTINAQGRTETWYNTVPSYVMAHVIYRLNIQPKKKKQP